LPAQNFYGGQALLRGPCQPVGQVFPGCEMFGEIFFGDGFLDHLDIEVKLINLITHILSKISNIIKKFKISWKFL
jgi:hypothetical protein